MVLGFWHYEKGEIDWENQRKLRLFPKQCSTFKVKLQVLSSTFWKVSIVYFLPDLFLFMLSRVMDSHLKHWDIYISFQGEETWRLNYCIPIYWSERNFLCSFLHLFGGFFHVIFGVTFLVDYSWLPFLKGGYHCGGIFLTLIGEYFRSLLLSSQQVVSEFGCEISYSWKGWR